MQTISVFSGMAYSYVPQEEQKDLFKLEGMNICRCFQDDNDDWWFTSRELMYYVDIDSGEPIYEWENPWTGETVNVNHVANNPVMGGFGPGDGEFPLDTVMNGKIATSVQDINLYYPNPMAHQEHFMEYSPQDWYEGGEFFKWFIDADELKTEGPSISDKAYYAWSRTSQWLPWMKMGDRPGTLLYSTTGSVVDSIDDLPPYMVKDIRERLPLYANAPKCVLDMEDETSWTYFMKNFDAYLNGDQFPVPAPDVDFPCKVVPKK